MMILWPRTICRTFNPNFQGNIFPLFYFYAIAMWLQWQRECTTLHFIYNIHIIFIMCSCSECAHNVLCASFNILCLLRVWWNVTISDMNLSFSRTLPIPLKFIKINDNNFWDNWFWIFGPKPSKGNRFIFTS